MDDGSNLDESITSSSNNDDVNGNSSTSEPNLQDASRERTQRAKPFLCPNGQCGMRAYTAEGLRGHMDSCPHRKRQQNSSFQCNLCPKTFKSERGLKSHKDRHERDKTNPKGMARYVCRICRVTYYDSLYVKLRPYNCTHCPYRYAALASLTKHVYDHHTDRADGSRSRNRLRTPYYCEQCPRRFFVRRKLREHIAVVHAKSTRPHNSSSGSRESSQSQAEESDEHDHDHEPIPSTSRGVPTRRRRHSSSSSSSSNSTGDEESRKKKSFSCSRCDKVYVSEYFFKLHQRTHKHYSSSEESMDETATSATPAKRRKIYYDPSIILTPCSVVLRRLEDVSVVYESDEEQEQDDRDPLAVHSENEIEIVADIPVEMEVEVENNDAEELSDEVEVAGGFNNRVVEPQSSGVDAGLSTRSSGYATHGSRDIEDLDEEEEPDFSLSFPDESEEQETDSPPNLDEVEATGYAPAGHSWDTSSDSLDGDLEENPGSPVNASSPLPPENASSSDTEENEGLPNTR